MKLLTSTEKRELLLLQPVQIQAHLWRLLQLLRQHQLLHQRLKSN
jgi:hypothetical protein